MPLTLILGPMKSGKSFDLISYFAPLKHTNIPFALYQPVKNVRDDGICSRTGMRLAAKKINSLKEITADNRTTIGIDEIHIFNAQEAKFIAELLKQKTKLIIAGLDTDYRGRIFAIIKKLLELGPAEVHYKRAVCELCRQPNAVYTQILKNNRVVRSGLPPSVPDDGTFTYRAVCRHCFGRNR